MLIARPLSSAFQQSLSTPPPRANGALRPSPERNLNAIISPLFLLAPHAVLKTKKNKLESCRTGTRPYISLRGPRINGPMAYAKTKIERTNCCSTSFVILNSDAIELIAGVTIEDETGEMKVKDETTSVAAHLRRFVQFFGFSGSSGPFHVTLFAHSV